MSALRVLFVIAVSAMTWSPRAGAQTQYAELPMAQLGGGPGEYYKTLPAFPASFGTPVSARMEVHGTVTHQLYLVNPSPWFGVNLDISYGAGVYTYLNPPQVAPFLSVANTGSFPDTVGPTPGSDACSWSGGWDMFFPQAFGGSSEADPWLWPSHNFDMYYYPSQSVEALLESDRSKYAFQCDAVSPDLTFSMTLYAKYSYGPNDVWVPPAGVANLGNALPGSTGTPTLKAETTHEDGAPTWLALNGGAPRASAWIVVAAGVANVPLFGGVCVPNPVGAFLIPVELDADGQLALNVPWPAGLPAGSAIIQIWIHDPTGVHGWTASNGVSV
jgi:hypothetical protein